MAEFVDKILKDAAAKQAVKYKSVEVHKNVPLDFDLGNLLAIDINTIDLKEYRSNPESYLKEIARDNTQLLINKIWELPIEEVDDVVVAKIPPPTTVIPREKPAPKKKPPTKWEQYAREKGITKKKKANLVWDEVLKDWRPRWGYKHARAVKEKDWMIEIPANADPYEDQFAKKSEAKKERVAKNEYQRLRNIAKSKNVKIPRVGIVPSEKQSRDEVEKAVMLAKSSTASLGKFTDNVRNEKPSRNRGKKRQFKPVIGDLREEQKNSLKIFETLSSKKPKLNLSRAINQQITEDESRPREKKIPKRRSKAGEKLRGKGKSKLGGKGKRGGKM